MNPKNTTLFSPEEDAFMLDLWNKGLSASLIADKMAEVFPTARGNANVQRRLGLLGARKHEVAETRALQSYNRKKRTRTWAEVMDAAT